MHIDCQIIVQSNPNGSYSTGNPAMCRDKRFRHKHGGLGDIPGEKGRQEDEAAGDFRTSFVGFVRTG